MQSSFMEILTRMWSHFYESALTFLPNLLAALVIVVVGGVAAWVVKCVIRVALRTAKFDRYCANAGATHLLTRADIHSPPSAIAGRVVFWLLFAVFLMFAVSAMEVQAVRQLVSEFFLYLPRLFAALFILIFGFVLGNFLARAVLLATVDAGFPSPRLVSGIVRLLVAILALAMALDQLRIASSIVITAFAVSFGAVMFGLTIAFGLGGRDLARRILEERLMKKKDAPPDEFSHI
jgi:hypothetical protein